MPYFRNGINKIKLPFKIKKPVLALGSHGKNTICFAKGDLAILSEIHHDLSNPKYFFDFQKTLKYFLRKHPQIIAYDLHPEYQSSKYALNLDARRYTLYAIQHHHAHIAACMADNGLKNQKVIGVAFDGTGLGQDRTLWGAEFLICDYKGFRRAAYLKEIPLLGGQQAILEPWRLAAWWLYLAYDDKFLNLKINFVKGINRKRWKILQSLPLSGVNSPYASSMGRLFDALACLVLAKYKADFEAGLAIELEKVASTYSSQATCRGTGRGTGNTTGWVPRQATGRGTGNTTGWVPRQATGRGTGNTTGRGPGVSAYPFRVTRHKGKYEISPLPLFKQVVMDLEAGEPKRKIAYRFHLTVAQMIAKTCSLLKKEAGINKVVLSGGVFQNNLLLNLSRGLLYKEGFKHFAQNKLACNDSNVSLGQAVVASFKTKQD